MNAFARHGHRSRNRVSLHRPASALAAAAVLGAIALPGCQAETLGPTGRGATERTDAPFKLQLRSHYIDESQCAAPVTATAEGGHSSAYAVWGELEARSYDFETNEFIRGRTQPLHPDVFEAPAIASGQVQWGEVGLEWFRRDASEPVLVELDFHATIYEAGETGGGEPQITRLSLSCR